MIKLTPYLNDWKNPPQVVMTPAADNDVQIKVRGEHKLDVSADFLHHAVAVSAGEFIGWDILEKSLWFKSRPVHAFDGVQIKTPEGVLIDAAVLHLRRDDPAWVVLSPSEAPLPDTYVDERVVEEVRLQYL